MQPTTTLKEYDTDGNNWAQSSEVSDNVSDDYFYTALQFISYCISHCRRLDFIAKGQKTDEHIHTYMKFMDSIGISCSGEGAPSNETAHD